jgi:hypothetical protein
VSQRLLRSSGYRTAPYVPLTGRLGTWYLVLVPVQVSTRYLSGTLVLVPGTWYVPGILRRVSLVPGTYPPKKANAMRTPYSLHGKFDGFP